MKRINNLLIVFTLLIFVFVPIDIILAQDTDRKQIEVEDIITKVKQRIDISYKNVEIIGNLNFSDIGDDIYSDITFENCVFKGSIIAQAVNFHGKFSITKSEVRSYVMLNNTKFYQQAKFNNTKFKGEVLFAESEFLDIANFTETIFERLVDFKKTQFSGMAVFLEAVFRGYADFRNTNFKYGVIFMDANFIGGANFTNCTLNSESFNPFL